MVEARLKGELSHLFAVHADLERAAMRFDPHDPHAEIELPHDVFEGYRHLHARSVDMLQALKRVLVDPEHDMVMTLGRRLDFVMPDKARFADKLERFESFLETFNLQASRHGVERVGLKPITARGLHEMVRFNFDLVVSVLGGCFETGYMKCFNRLKQYGFPYAGATALQETVDVYSGLSRMQRIYERQARPRTLH